MIRFIFILFTAFFINGALAESPQKPITPVPVAEVENNESIVVEHDLATHMGWSDQQAVFKAPRNFRTKELNNVSPDSLEADTSGNESNN
jgi:hypothetical protein